MSIHSLSAPSAHPSRVTTAGNGLVVICLLSVFTISTGSAVLFGLPQVFVMSVVFSVFMLLVLRLTVELAPLQFAFVYLLSVMPGTILAAFDGDLEGRSFVQLIASLGTFVIVSSFATKWQDVNSREAKQRALEIAILLFAALGVFEIFFYGWIFELKTFLYGAHAIPDAEFRDTHLYGMPRPTGMFSEASNYARFMGVLVAAYLIVSRRVLRSLLYIAGFVLLTRSPSFWFAAPAMVLGLMAANPRRAIAGFWTTFAKGVTGPLVATGVVIFSILGFVSQADRIDAILEGNERSFNERIRDPINFLVEEWDSPALGSGATAQNEIAGITKGVKRLGQLKGLIIESDLYRQATATTILIIIAMGALGLGIFFIGVGWLQGSNGMILIGAFLFSNFLTSGYNSATMWVPCALLFSLCWTVLSGQKAMDPSPR